MSYISKGISQKYSFLFELTLNKVNILLENPLTLFVVIKRGKKACSTKKKVTSNPKLNSIDIKETLVIRASLYRNANGNSYQEKKAILKLYAETNNGTPKLLGEARLNLAEYAEKPLGINQVLKIFNSEDKNAFFDISIKGKQIENISNQFNQDNDKPSFDKLNSEKDKFGFELAYQEKSKSTIVSEKHHSNSYYMQKDKDSMISDNIKYEKGEKSSFKGMQKRENEEIKINPDNIMIKAKSVMGKSKEIRKSEIIGNVENNSISEENKDNISNQADSAYNQGNSLIEKQNISASFKKQFKRVDTFNVTAPKIENERDLIINNLRKQNDQLEKDLQETNKSIFSEKEKLVQEITILRSKYKQLEELYKRSEEQINEYKKRNSFTQKNQFLSNTGPNFQDISKLNAFKLESEIKELKSINENLNKKIKQKEEEIDSLYKHINQIKKECLEIRAKLEISLKEGDKNSIISLYKSQTDAIIKEKDMQIKSLENNLHNYKIKENELVKELTYLKASNVSQTNASEEKEKLELNPENVRKKCEIYENKIKELSKENNKLRLMINYKVSNNNNNNNNNSKNKNSDTVNDEKIQNKQGMLNYTKEFEELKKQVNLKIKELETEKILRAKLEKELLRNQMNSNSSELNLNLNINQDDSQTLEKSKESPKNRLAEIGHKLASDKDFKKLVVQNDLLIQEKRILEDKIKKLEYAQSGESYNASDKSLRELVENLKKEILGYKEEIIKLQTRNREVEEQFVKAKVEWAKSEEMKEIALHNLKEKTEIVKSYTSKIAKLEGELVKAKQDLGEALNTNFEFEQENVRLNEKLSSSPKYPTKK